MAEVQVVGVDAFRSAHAEFLKEEKEATRMLDALNNKRRALPATKIEAPSNFIFIASDGSKKTLLDLFEGRQQLIIYHFMLKDSDKEGCTGCSFAMDNVPELSHLNFKNTTFAAVAPAEVDKVNLFKDRMGWKFPFYSSKYTFEEVDKAGEDVTWKPKEGLFRLVVFLKRGDEVLNTYNTGNRGVEEPLLSTLGLLDLTPLGRRDDEDGDWKLHDQY